MGESKISKSFAITAQINVLCQNIEQPAAPFALRLSSALMLGVVRVFSRKSTIILADTNSVLHAVKRYSAQPSAKSSAKKRTRAQDRDPHRIDLQEGNDKARFDLITLPARKKFKHSRKGAQSNQRASATKSAGSQSYDIRSHASIMLNDLSFGDSAEIDVLAAIQNVFPTVAVPRLGEHLPSGLNSPTSVHNLGTQRKMLYSARDQDITLSQPIPGLDDMDGFNVFDEDLRGSIRSDPISNVGDSRPPWIAGMGMLGDNGHFQQNDSLSIAPSQSQASCGNAAISPFHGSHGDVNLEPMELEPLDIPTTHPAPERSAKKKPKETSKLVSVAVSPPSVNESNFRTPEGNRNQRRGFSFPPATNSSRKRRSSILRNDPVTEISPSEIRNYLNDVTDILLTGFDERQAASSRKNNRRAPAKPATFEIPRILSLFSNEITDLWRTTTASPRTVTEERQRIGLGPSPPSRFPIARRIRTRNASQRRGEFETIEFPQQNDQEMLPVMDIQPLPAVEKNNSSADADRANSGPSKAPSVDLFSVPSNSAHAGSHSKRSSGESSIGRNDHYRDFLDKVSAGHMAFRVYTCLYIKGNLTKLSLSAVSPFLSNFLPRSPPLIVELLTWLDRQDKRFRKVRSSKEPFYSGYATQGTPR